MWRWEQPADAGGALFPGSAVFAGESGYGHGAVGGVDPEHVASQDDGGLLVGASMDGVGCDGEGAGYEQCGDGDDKHGLCLVVGAFARLYDLADHGLDLGEGLRCVVDDLDALGPGLADVEAD